MEIIKINGHRYYQYETIIETHPSLKYHRYKSEFIKKHQIPTTSYIHARLNKNIWTVYKKLAISIHFIIILFLQKSIII